MYHYTNGKIAYNSLAPNQNLLPAPMSEDVDHVWYFIDMVIKMQCISLFQL